MFNEEMCNVIRHCKTQHSKERTISYRMNVFTLDFRSKWCRHRLQTNSRRVFACSDFVERRKMSFAIHSSHFHLRE